MARSAQPNLTHRPKDFATLEQAGSLAVQAARQEIGKALGLSPKVYEAWSLAPASHVRAVIHNALLSMAARLRREMAPWYVKLWRRWTGR